MYNLKEIQIGFGKLLNQYKQKTDKIQNMNIFEKHPENWHPCEKMKKTPGDNYHFTHVHHK